MTRCSTAESGALALFHYDELPPADRQAVASHVARCESCRAALDDLRTIGRVLTPAPAQPQQGWAAFMAHLEARLDALQGGTPSRGGRMRLAWLAAAAALALAVGGGSLLVFRARSGVTPDATVATRPSEAALASAGGQLLDRSRLVVFGLLAQDATSSSGDDWSYERELAGDLWADARLLRQAAASHGMAPLADTLGDLELVLLETAFSEPSDGALARVQDLIRARDLRLKLETMRPSAAVP
jgi:hypothetical protein